MLARHSLERRLFGWLLALALIPPLVILGVTLVVSAGSLEWIGTLGPWDQVAESGRQLVEAAEPAATADPELRAALDRHKLHLSESLVQARRWSFLGGRLASAMPVAIASIALILAALAFQVSRMLARDLARPIRDLVAWSGRMARDEPLPAPTKAEASEVAEVRTLREALRDASSRIGEARTRALEAERVRAWGEMARRVAHEMKNPLTPLRLAAYRLAKGGSDEAVAVAVAVIGEETGRLDELARNFATLGRPSSGPASPVDVRELLEGLLSSDVPPAIERSLEVAPGTVVIEAYHDALLRAFRNLIRNAVEAVESAGGGRVDLAVAPWNEGGVEVVVSDTGRGIPEGVSERIFEPDYTLKAGGTGLGLAVVRQAIAAHGGRVEARRRVTGGAEFVVRLPATPRTGVV
jgi:signal transduction histidine kinase